MERFDPDALSVLGVSAVLTVNEPPSALAAGDATRLRPEYQKDKVEIWSNPEALPRAFFVAAARRIETPADVFERDEHGLLARRMVLLADAPTALLPIPAEPSGTVNWLIDRPELIELLLDAPSDGYVVLLDTFYPGWRVKLDGADAPLLRANLAFRAVAVSAGKHALRFEYRPASVTAGLLISLLAGLAWLAALLSGLRRKRIDSAEPVD